MRLTRVLLSSVAMFAAVPALAQTTDTATATPAGTAAEQDTTNPAPVDGDSATGTNQDIVITAQGRAQSLSKVPVAVSAVSAETLQNSGANDIRQLNQLAPSLLVSSTGTEANASPRIRGIGTVGDNPGLESSVVVFIDGVYRSRSGIGLNELGEIDRVEVLRGPQGTLGGRNSSAGLISIISKAPSFSGFSGMAEGTYGNYDYYRLQGALNLPISDKIAARVDGVYVKRDGFYSDPNNDGRVNDRDRYFVRGQLRLEPVEGLNIRLIGDYTKRTEACCGAIYVGPSVNEKVGNLNTPVASVNAGVATFAGGNNIVNVLRDLTALRYPTARQPNFTPGYDRTLAVTPGRTYEGKTQDYGFSGQIDYDLGGVKLTSITAYRDYYTTQPGDVDYSTLDIIYNAPGDGNRREFKTLTQELRLNGSAFDNKLDWLVGGFFADEKFRGRSNLRFGNDYGRFASCRAVSGGSLAAFYAPGNAGCLSAGARAGLPAGAFAAAGISAPVGTALLAAFDNLDSINDKGSTVDRYYQDSTSFAAFTHNIFHVTDTVDLTLGLRYTNETKRFRANLGNDNTACVTQQALLGGFLATPLAATAGGLIGLACQGNSTSELNGVALRDRRHEDEFTGTAILSWKPIDNLLTYASYSRGYKAGGFNFDRSALKNPVLSFASFGGGSAAAGAQALVGNLQFEPEKVNAYEIGAKYATGPFSLSLAAFRQEFKNFQLNTFDGTVFIVQNINGCSSDLGGADRDQSKFTTAPNYNAAAATTGACPKDDTGYGVRSQGVELEASLVPVRDFRIGLGFTLADTKYRDDLVGTSNGAPLNQALRLLPGSQLSNAPRTVVTTSVAWTPDIGSSGVSGLFYVDSRTTSGYNTGSDLFPQKEQESFSVVNARIGLRGRDELWAVEFWGQNVFNVDYAQVAFNSPFQEGAVAAPFTDPQYPGGRQIFSQFLAEPRTYGVTVRTRF